MNNSAPIRYTKLQAKVRAPWLFWASFLNCNVSSLYPQTCRQDLFSPRSPYAFWAQRPRILVAANFLAADAPCILLLRDITDSICEHLPGRVKMVSHWAHPVFLSHRSDTGFAVFAATRRPLTGTLPSPILCNCVHLDESVDCASY